ncbi:MAG TPA: permease prefix domain 1-containing protein, partial [Bryobacteraceae bacterium]|nr:permease prefix domain 1-containing protein [Bryobacteraceae bacterium]
MRWWRRKQRERDLERELRSHVELEAEEQREAGASSEEARYAARRAFGNTTLVKEEVRRAWSERWFEDFFQDLRYTARHLRKAPGFTTAAVVSLAVGIGANTAIFTIINAVLLKSLPVRDPGNLVLLGDARGSGSGSGIPQGGSFVLYSYDLYKHLQDTNVFTELCAVQSTTETGVGIRLAGWGESQLAQAKLVSGNYFEVLGIKAAIGRAITPSDDSPSAPPVALVSFRYWKNKLGGDPSVIGSTIYVGGTPFT